VIKQLKDGWPPEALPVLLELAAPKRAMRLAVQPHGYYEVRASDIAILAPGGHLVQAEALFADFGWSTVLLPDLKTDDSLLYPGGYLTFGAIVPMDRDELPSTFSVTFRGKDFCEVTLSPPPD
jgi:hypothetical protein